MPSDQFIEKWLDALRENPEQAMDDLLRGRANLGPAGRHRPSYLLYHLFVSSPERRDENWASLDRGLAEWLNEQLSSKPLRSTSATSSAPSISDRTADRCCVGPRDSPGSSAPGCRLSTPFRRRRRAWAASTSIPIGARS